MKIFLEYVCPKGEWRSSRPAKTRDGFWYRGQTQLHINIPAIDCIFKEKNPKFGICDGCSGKVECYSVSLWDSEKSWKPIGEYKNRDDNLKKLKEVKK